MAVGQVRCSWFAVHGRWLVILYVDNTKPKIFTVAQVIHSARTPARGSAPVAYASRKTRARGSRTMLPLLVRQQTGQLGPAT